MSRYILDTDTVTLFQHGNPEIAQRAQAIGNSNIFITTVTLEEQMRGRLAVIQKNHANPDKLIIAYSNLRQTQAFFCRVNLLDFNATALNYYQTWRQQKVRIGSQDLKIAAIAIANQAIIVTRNRRDFGQVPGLSIEDWTVPQLT